MLDIKKAITELKEGKIECSPVMKEFFDKFLDIGNVFSFGFGPRKQPEVDLEKEIDRELDTRWKGLGCRNRKGDYDMKHIDADRIKENL